MKTDWMGLALLALLILALFFYGTVEMFLKPEQNITFNVVGIKGAKNATTLTSLHYECIKYCSFHEGSHKQSCWQQCEMLGREGCR